MSEIKLKLCPFCGEEASKMKAADIWNRRNSSKGGAAW